MNHDGRVVSLQGPEAQCWSRQFCWKANLISLSNNRLMSWWSLKLVRERQPPNFFRIELSIRLCR